MGGAVVATRQRLALARGAAAGVRLALALDELGELLRRHLVEVADRQLHVAVDDLEDEELLADREVAAKLGEQRLGRAGEVAAVVEEPPHRALAGVEDLLLAGASGARGVRDPRGKLPIDRSTELVHGFPEPFLVRGYPPAPGSVTVAHVDCVPSDVKPGLSPGQRSRARPASGRAGPRSSASDDVVAQVQRGVDAVAGRCGDGRRATPRAPAPRRRSAARAGRGRERARSSRVGVADRPGELPDRAAASPRSGPGTTGPGRVRAAPGRRRGRRARPRAARVPKTKHSLSEFEASRLAPCSPVHAASPTASRPGSVLRPSRSVWTPPIR